MKTKNYAKFVKRVKARRAAKTGKSKRLTELLNDPPLLVSVEDAQRLVGYKRSKLFSMLAEGTLQRVKSGKSTRVTMKSIMAFVEGRS